MVETHIEKEFGTMIQNPYTQHLRRRAQEVATAARNEITEEAPWTWTR